jgi:hypothetical protein
MAQKGSTNGETLQVADTTQKELGPDKSDVSDARSVPSGAQRIHGAAEQASLEGKEAQHVGSADDPGEGRKPRTETAVRKAPETVKGKPALSPDTQAYIRERGKGVKIAVRRKKGTLQTAWNGYKKGQDDGLMLGYEQGKADTRIRWKQINDRTRRRLDEVNAKLQLQRKVYFSGIAIGVAVGTGITLTVEAIL